MAERFQVPSMAYTGLPYILFATFTKESRVNCAETLYRAFILTAVRTALAGLLLHNSPKARPEAPRPMTACQILTAKTLTLQPETGPLKVTKTSSTS